MRLSDVFDQLTAGELSQLNMGGIDNIGIQPCDYPKVVPHINLGLAELFKRFSLRRQEVVVQQYDEIQTYYLDSKYAQTNTNSIVYKKYIMDSVYEPFTDNVLKIEKVINEIGEELYKNETDEYWSITTPAYNAIQVPYPEKENQMIITYRAAHDTILLKDLNPLETDVNISPGMLEPLLLYVAARVYANLTSGDGNEGQMFMAKFESSCAKIEQLGLQEKDETKNNKLDENGWI